MITVVCKRKANKQNKSCKEILLVFKTPPPLQNTCEKEEAGKAEEYINFKNKVNVVWWAFLSGTFFQYVTFCTFCLFHLPAERLPASAASLPLEAVQQ